MLLTSIALTIASLVTENPANALCVSFPPLRFGWLRCRKVLLIGICNAMINDLKVLALLPARGGSKGIRNKNIVSFCGNPLIAYSIEAARKSRYIDDIIVTTDSADIADVA